MTVSCQMFLRMTNVSDKVIEKIKIHILYSVTFLQKLCLFEIMSINMMDLERPTDDLIWPICFARWISKATDTL
jgi:hypothetical protein